MDYIESIPFPQFNTRVKWQSQFTSRKIRNPNTNLNNLALCVFVCCAIHHVWAELQPTDKFPTDELFVTSSYYDLTLCCPNSVIANMVVFLTQE